MPTPTPTPRPVPLPSTDYGSPDEESNRVFRRREGTLPGTRVGIPGRSDSPQDRRGNWVPGPIRRKP
jgi:hypothetical protein